MRAKTVRWFGVILLSTQVVTYGQSFRNLDFEDAQVSAPFHEGYVSAERAFHGWTVQATNSHQILPVIFYNVFSLSAPAVILFGPEYAGSYSAMLQYPDPGGNPDRPSSLSQIGFIPADARSIVFTLYEDSGYGRVMLDGVPIPLVATDVAFDPVIAVRMAGDVSAFAGRTAELKFTMATELAPRASEPLYFWFDDISFSTTPIPEPNSLCLVSLGVLLLRCRRVA